MAPAVTGPMEREVPSKVKPVGSNTTATNRRETTAPEKTAHPPTRGTGGCRVLSTAPARTPIAIHIGVAMPAAMAPMTKTRRYEPNDFLCGMVAFSQTLQRKALLSTLPRCRA